MWQASMDDERPRFLVPIGSWIIVSLNILEVLFPVASSRDQGFGQHIAAASFWANYQKGSARFGFFVLDLNSALNNLINHFWNNTNRVPSM